MILLLTNDDGVDAPGLQALRAAVAGLGAVHVVAPADPHSECGHRATMHATIRTDARGEVTAVYGTPVDCVRLALHGLVPRPTLVLSGINAGGNLGVDVYRSGTVAAAREAAHHGLPAIALSQLCRPPHLPAWEESTLLVARMFDELLQALPPPGSFLNVNLPHFDPGHVPRLVRCPVDLSPWPLDFAAEEGGWRFRGRLRDRPRQTGHDIDVCFGGDVSLSVIAG